ncbi:uncharacterized protein LOC142168225 [Nicotiana tabacum]|uniref:Uncharacterized protein LOC142168225 n=1 Tax=Nicotiana tabacum TaxID=4097 RepID=A0AC58SJ34_TOBAC
MDHRGPIINHLAYADDIVIFCGGNNMTIKLIKKVIDKYEKDSGQKVNSDKNFFITSPHHCAIRINRIRNANGYMDKSFPFSYLVCPIYYGRKTSNLFDGMLSKIIKNLNGWQANMLSSGGRIILIKHVLQSLSTYIMSAMNPLKGITKLMEKHFANFFWGTNDDEGGAGVRKMEDIIDTLSIKRWWRFKTQPSLWAKFLKSKYCKRAHPVNKRVKKFLDNGEWSNGKLNEFLPDHITDSIAHMKIGDPNEDDFPVEIVQHVFNSSNTANFIWNSIGNALGMKHQQEPVIATFKRWWETSANNKVHNQILQIAPTIICWELWKQRNACRYEKHKKFQLNTMRHQNIWALKAAISNFVPGDYTQMEWPLLCDKIERLKPSQKWMQVTWEPPLPGTVKVNTDGSFSKKSGKAGIGGVVRDCHGNLIMTFSIPISCDSNTMVEAKAAEFGVKWCNQHGYTNFSLELDSMVVADMLAEGDTNNVKIKMVIDKASYIVKQARVNVKHCFREGNQVADCLAKLATTTNQRRLFHSFQQMPNSAKGPFLLDK